ATRHQGGPWARRSGSPCTSYGRRLTRAVQRWEAPIPEELWDAAGKATRWEAVYWGVLELLEGVTSAPTLLPFWAGATGRMGANWEQMGQTCPDNGRLRRISGLAGSPCSERPCTLMDKGRPGPPAPRHPRLASPGRFRRNLTAKRLHPVPSGNSVG